MYRKTDWASALVLRILSSLSSLVTRKTHNARWCFAVRLLSCHPPRMTNATRDLVKKKKSTGIYKLGIFLGKRALETSVCVWGGRSNYPIMTEALRFPFLFLIVSNVIVRPIVESSTDRLTASKYSYIGGNQFYVWHR
jgi:hypothetical protein